MPHYLPSDFEIDTDTRTVTHKASGRKYSWDRSSEMGEATHYHHSPEGIRIFRSATAMISVTGSKHFESRSTRRDARSPRKMDGYDAVFLERTRPGTSGV